MVNDACVPTGTDFYFGNPLVISVAVPEKIIGLTLSLDFFDRCHSSALRASLRSVALCTPTAVGGLRLASPATGSARLRSPLCKEEGSELHPTAPFQGSWRRSRLRVALGGQSRAGELLRKD